MRRGHDGRRLGFIAVKHLAVEFAGLGIEGDRLDLVALTRVSVDQAQAATARHSLRLEAPEGPLVGWWDPERLEQVLRNLLFNAIKYAPEGGEIRVQVEDCDGEARVSVADQGAGISPEALPQLFERHYRAQDTARQARGTGLGLATVYGIVKQSGGHIAVYSEPGHGTTVKLYLPRLHPSARLAGGREAALDMERRAAAPLAVALEELAARAETPAEEVDDDRHDIRPNDRVLLVIEDDPYGELVYVDGADTTPMKSFDATGRVIYLGSFSKIVAPGLRVGWAVTPPAVRRQLQLASEATTICPSVLSQMLIEEYVTHHDWRGVLDRARGLYSARSAAMQAALAEQVLLADHLVEALRSIFLDPDFLHSRPQRPRASGGRVISLWRARRIYPMVRSSSSETAPIGLISVMDCPPAKRSPTARRWSSTTRDPLSPAAERRSATIWPRKIALFPP